MRTPGRSVLVIAFPNQRYLAQLPADLGGKDRTDRREENYWKSLKISRRVYRVVRSSSSALLSRIYVGNPMYVTTTCGEMTMWCVFDFIMLSPLQPGQGDLFEAVLYMFDCDHGCSRRVV